MNSHFEARKAYLRNVLISTGICLYLYIFQTNIIFRLCDSDEEIAAIVWPICLVVLYGILAWIRGNGKGWAYTGKLKAIPVIFVVYMLLSAGIAFFSIL